MVKEENVKKKESKETIRDFIRTGAFFLAALLICMWTVHYCAQITLVVGDSMEDTLHNSDSVIVDKLVYRFKDPERFDVILFPYVNEKDGTSEALIKRIIGLPGEAVRIEDGVIYIDGEVLEDPYAAEDWSYAGYAEDTVVLGEDEYFVMGDNRNYSKDSRTVDVYGRPVIGAVHRYEIIGKARLRILPLHSIGPVR